MKYVRDRISLFQDSRSFLLQRERLEMNMELETIASLCLEGHARPKIAFQQHSSPGKEIHKNLKLDAGLEPALEVVFF